MNRFAVIPALNESNSLANVVYSLSTYVDKIVVVDDGSFDNTSDVAKKAGAIVLRNEFNLGYEVSITQGLLYACSQNASSVITFDADGQHPYDKVELMFGYIESGAYDVVIACREYLPRLSERIFSAYTNIKYDISDVLSGMKCYSRHALINSGVKSAWNSVGSYITLHSITTGLSVKTVSIRTYSRKDSSRFGLSIKSESIVLMAFLNAIFRIHA